MLSEFPFLFDGYAGWVCRHCSHLAYYYRGPNYVWKNPQPPPNYFVDQHLMFCPGLNPSIAANIESIRQQSQSAQKMSPDAKNQPTTASELKRKLDPPTGRSPQPPSAAAAVQVKEFRVDRIEALGILTLAEVSGSGCLRSGLWLLRLMLGVFPPAWAAALDYATPSAHFLDSAARGVVDLRDLVYFVSLGAAALYGNVLLVERRRWGG